MGIILSESLRNHALDTNNDNLSNNLSSLLKKHNISESDLARTLNLPYNTIHRLVTGHTIDPRISTLKAIAGYFKVKLDALLGPECLSVNEENHSEPNNRGINETLLHYILKQSHHLYPSNKDSNHDYADFVLELLNEISGIDTTNDNLIKIINLAIGSVSSYEEAYRKHYHAV